MNVLFLTHRLPYAPNRGDRIRAFHILRQIANHARVHLVSLVHDAEELSHVPELNGIAASIATAFVSKRRNLIRAASTFATGGTLTHALLHGREIEAILKSTAEQSSPDVVLAYCSGMAKLASFGSLAGIPMVLDMLDVDSEKWAAFGDRARAPMKWVYQREARELSAFESLAASRAAVTTVVNQRERDALKRLAPTADVRIIPNGIDTIRFRPSGAPTEEPRVVFCGVFNYKPNEEGALWLGRHVWPLVRAKHPGARLALVGADPSRAVRNLSRHDPSIEVTGWVPDVRPYLWRSAVATAPLFIARGIQNKVLEGVAAGLPCVVTPVVREGLPEEAIPACMTAGTAEEFHLAIVDLLGRSADERRALAGSAKLERLTWSAQLEELPRILEFVASRHSRDLTDRATD